MEDEKTKEETGITELSLRLRLRKKGAACENGFSRSPGEATPQTNSKGDRASSQCEGGKPREKGKGWGGDRGKGHNK